MCQVESEQPLFRALQRIIARAGRLRILEPQATAALLRRFFTVAASLRIGAVLLTQLTVPSTVSAPTPAGDGESLRHLIDGIVYN